MRSEKKIDWQEAYVMLLQASEMSECVKKKREEDAWLNECQQARGGSMTQNENANI